MNPNLEKQIPPQENLDPTAVNVAESAYDAAGNRLREAVQESNEQVALLGGESLDQRDRRKNLSMDSEFEETELSYQRRLQRRQERREKFTTIAHTVGRLLTRR